MAVTDWISGRCFNLVHAHNLVYNTCWEDPQLDREALAINGDDHLLVITSAGCNALDYLLDEPKHVYAVDLNFRQNALLDLKVAAIRRLDFDTFFAMFGTGRLTCAKDVYVKQLRAELPAASRAYWDRRIDAFSGRGPRGSFYFRGTSGTFAWMINAYIDRIAKMREQVNAVLNAQTLEEQREIYRMVHSKLWSGSMRWFVRRDSTLALLGVPRPQRLQVDRDYDGGIGRFIEDCVETVFAGLPLRNNYFWRLYLTGSYTRECCPEYLRPEHFARLKSGLIDRLSTHTTSIGDFVRQAEAPLSKLVLLDHMDWMSHAAMPQLERQWQWIVDRAAPGARVLWRSAGTRADHIDQLQVHRGAESVRLGEYLTYNRELASRLHARDRVHTYGSFYIADLAA